MPNVVVDVLMPVRAPAPWLNQALDSLTMVEGVVWGLIVAIHGSGHVFDRKIKDYFPQATILHLPQELPFPEVLNRGLEVSRAPFIARVDSDDLTKAGRLSLPTDLLINSPSVSLVVNSSELIDEVGTRIGLRQLSRDPEIELKRLRWKNPFTHSATTFRRNEALRVGGYRASALHAEDYDLWLRLAAEGEVAILPEVLTSQRIHSGQVTRSISMPEETSKTLLDSRVRLAISRGESKAAAHLRGKVWEFRQRLRSLEFSASRSQQDGTSR